MKMNTSGHRHRRAAAAAATTFCKAAVGDDRITAAARVAARPSEVLVIVDPEHSVDHGGTWRHRRLGNVWWWRQQEGC